MKTFIKTCLLTILLILIGFTSLACTSQTTTTTTTQDTSVEEQIVVNQLQVELSINSSFQILYTMILNDTSGDLTVVFSSSDELIASVNQQGVITGQSIGSCSIYLNYHGYLSAVVEVVVSNRYVVVQPTKTVYQPGNSLNLSGGSLEIYDSSGTLSESIDLNSSMITSYDNQLVGSQIVEFVYQNVTFGFEVYILNEKQEASLMDDIILLNNESSVGELAEFALTKANIADMLESVENIYDYSEVEIYGLFTMPSGDVKKVDAFWYQDYHESITYTDVNTSNNLEGKVNDTSEDYDLILDYVKENNPQFRLRYLPTEAGECSLEIVIKVDGVLIQTFHKSFTVLEQTTDDYQGFLEVDSSSNRHFVFSEGGTYIPVGQNVAWYTSADRKYYDYLNWFDQMGQAKMNYARVWMAAWGYSIFWDDVYSYDQRQDNLYSLDRTIEIADENDIYIQLCILHHGMFSQEVNPMWPNSSNTWYTSKYGSNPYSEYLSNPGLFFTNDEARSSFKNQLKYIVARYAYSDNIMSWELFNEVDWIETYTALTGTYWHKEMAEYIKSIDPYQHLVTTSVKSDSFLSSTYQVFNLNAIDYVNVHSYGIYNHVSVLPTKQNNGFEVFNKPILYDEVGYSGNGGADQYSKDPNNVTLHQELWAGAMGGGAGTGMNWWWESWIETYDLYDQYTAISIYTSQMNLVAETTYQVLASSDSDYNHATLDRSDCGYMGYVVDDRVYLYLFDTYYALFNQDVATKSNLTFSMDDFIQGTYSVDFYNTYTGDILSSQTIVVTQSGVLSVDIPSFTADIAVIIKPNT